MPAEPAVKRTIAFVDGQNLFHNVRSVFGYTYPNYDVQKLAQAVCGAHGWTLQRVQFYTGVTIVPRHDCPEREHFPGDREDGWPGGRGTAMSAPGRRHGCGEIFAGCFGPINWWFRVAVGGGQKMI